MIVSRKRRVLFVHVQKTGGSTIDLVLLDKLPGARPVRRVHDRHATWADAVQLNADFADFYTFGFVRNPWARLHSWHEMILRRKEQAEAQPDGRAARLVVKNKLWSGVLADYPTFESFVLEAPKDFPQLERPQLHYLQTEGASGRRADFIGRTERLSDDLNVVFEQIGLDPLAEVPQANRNREKRVDYHDVYTPEMRDAVGERFAIDIDEFGYDF